MILPDICVLVAAGRTDHCHHTIARQALEQVFIRKQPILLPSSVLTGMIRIATNPRIFPNPTSLEDAFTAAQNYLDYPHTRRIEPGPDHFSILQSLVLSAQIGAAHISDAALAAIAIERRAELWTLDGGFVKYPGLQWKHLLQK